MVSTRLVLLMVCAPTLACGSESSSADGTDGGTGGGATDGSSQGDGEASGDDSQTGGTGTAGATDADGTADDDGSDGSGGDIEPSTRFADEAIEWNVPVSSASAEAATGICDAADVGFDALAASSCTRWSTIDIDGDGALDLVSPWDTSNGNAVYGFGTQNHYWLVFLGTTTGFASEAMEWSVPISSASAEAATGICDGSDAGFDALAASGCTRWSTIDIDGDGRLDLVSPWDTSNGNAVYGFGTQDHYWRVFLGTGTGFADEATQWSVPVSSASAEASTGICDGSDSGFDVLTASGCTRWSTVDINGDGSLDLVSPWDTSDGNAVYGFGTQSQYWRVFLGSASGFADDATEWAVPVSSASAEASTGICDGSDSGFDALAASECTRWSTVDIDGDGRLDLVSPWDTSNGNAVYGFGTRNHHWRVFLGNASGFASEPTEWSVPVSSASAEAATGICDGSDSGFDTLAASGCTRWSTVDIDGDGALDLVSPWDTSNGNAVYGFDTQDHEWRVFLGNGSGFASEPTAWSVPVSGASAEASTGICDGSDTGFDALAASECTRWSTVDIDGDGRLDLVSPWDTSNGNAVYGFGTRSHHWRVFLGEP